MKKVSRKLIIRYFIILFSITIIGYGICQNKIYHNINNDKVLASDTFRLTSSYIYLAKDDVQQC